MMRRDPCADTTELRSSVSVPHFDGIGREALGSRHNRETLSPDSRYEGMLALAEIAPLVRC